MPSQIRRSLYPTVFALIGICFFLSFATVSCDGERTKFTGAELITQRVPPAGKLKKDRCSDALGECVERSASARATLALLVAALGSLLAAFGVSRGPGWCAGVGLIVMLTFATNAADLHGPDVRFHLGYVAILLLFVTAAVWSLARRSRRNRSPEEAGRDPAPPPIQSLLTGFWAGLCIVLISRYDFSPTSTFGLVLFVALLVVVAASVLHLIRLAVRLARSSGPRAGRRPSVQG
jgi:hypothetical protein